MRRSRALERRAYARRAVIFPVVLVTGDGARYPAEMRDLGPGGAYVRSEFLIPACTPCWVQTAAAMVPATVVRVSDQSSGFGLALWYDEAAALDEVAVWRARKNNGAPEGNPRGRIEGSG